MERFNQLYVFVDDGSDELVGVEIEQLESKITPQSAAGFLD